MASTLEMTDKKTGTLSSTEVINSEMTKIIANLYVYGEMLSEERVTEKKIIKEFNRDLCELRGYLNAHFEYKEKV